MSGNLDTVTIQQFRDMVINKYQQMQPKLAGKAEEVRGAVGDAYKWPIALPVSMYDRGAYHSEVKRVIAKYDRVTTEFLDKIVQMPTDVFQQTNTNVNEKENLAKQIAASIARMEDQIVIDAFDASSTPNIVAAGGKNLDLDKLREAARILDNNNVPDADRYYFAHASQKESLLSEEETTSADYNTVKALVNGQINSFMGFQFIWFGAMPEGGVKKVGNIRQTYAWHIPAVGKVYKMNPMVDVEWAATFQSYLATGKFVAGASALQNDGIVQVLCDES